MKRCLNLECNKELPVNTKSPGQKYCNKKCWLEHLAQKRSTQVFLKCNNPACDKFILDENNSRKYCSKSCSAVVNNSKNPKKKAEDKLKKICSIHLKKDLDNIYDSDIDAFIETVCSIYKVNSSVRLTTRDLIIPSSYEGIISKVIKDKGLFKYRIKKVSRLIPKPLKNINDKKKRLCFHCHIPLKNQRRKYCDEHTSMYSNNGKALYKFTFKVTDYPDLLDLSLIGKHGWFSPGGGKCSLPKNLEGISRDHKVSINDAIKHGYDPYYIKHPCNCELMLHKDNYKKKTNSSITYDELVLLVDSYDIGRAQQT